MKNVFMLIRSIQENKGGMTMAMLNRSRAFYDNSYSANIVTFDYNLNYNQVTKNLKKSNRMDERTKIYNIFDYFEKSSRIKKFVSNERKEHNYLLKKLDKLFEVKKTEEVSRYYSKQTGEYMYYVRTNNNKIQYIDCFKGNKRYKRIHFKDKIKRLTEYFNEENKKVNKIYFNKKEQPYLNITLEEENQKVLSITLLNEEKTFKTTRDFSIYFLESLMGKSKVNILISDGPGNVDRMLGVKDKNVKKIAVIHTNHFLYPYKYGAPIKKVIKNILTKAKQIDHIIVLTKKQKQDIVKQYKLDNISVIPNFQTMSKPLKKEKPQNIVGYISRFVENKGFDRLLKVADIVKLKDPSIKFHLYGTGKHKQQIIKEIKNRKLDDFVKVKGYTNDVNKTLSNFDLSIFTSYYEAFGLSISESMEQRVPVIAMNINYGPSDLIEDGKNGYLVADNDVEGMANKIVELAQNKKRIKKFGKNARKKVLKDLNTTRLMKKWKEIL